MAAIQNVGSVTALLARLTAVCASNRPLIDAPVPSTIAVLHSMMPSACEVVPMVTAPATCQKTFLAWAPPLKAMALLALRTRSPVI